MDNQPSKKRNLKKPTCSRPPPGFPAKAYNDQLNKRQTNTVAIVSIPEEYRNLFDVNLKSKTSKPVNNDNNKNDGAKETNCQTGSCSHRNRPVSETQTRSNPICVKEILDVPLPPEGSKLKCPSKSTPQFTGKEKSFIPKQRFAAAIQNKEWNKQPSEKYVTEVKENQGKLETEQKLLRLVDNGNIDNNITACKANKIDSEIKSSNTPPVLKAPYNLHSLLRPVPPLEQIQMEIEAGIKPSFLSPFVYQQTLNYINKQSLQNKVAISPIATIRPILGRRQENVQAREASYSGGMQSTNDLGNQTVCTAQNIPKAHNNHPTTALTSDDSAIIISAQGEDGIPKPIDLSKTSTQISAGNKSQQVNKETAADKDPNLNDKEDKSNTHNDFAILWNQMTKDSNIVSDTLENTLCHAKRKDGQNQGSSVNNSCPFTGNEKPFIPRARCNVEEFVAAKPDEKFFREGNDYIVPCDTVRQLNGELKGEGISDNLTGDTCEGQSFQTVHAKSPSESTDVENNILPKGQTDEDSNSLIISNDSSTTLPYGDTSDETLDLSDQSNKSVKKYDQNSCSLEVEGKAIQSKVEDYTQPSSPVESSDGLMDSIYEEDMVKGDSNLENESSEQTFRVNGNNIWNQSSDSYNYPPVGEPYVSDSDEDDYLTCNTSAEYDAAPILSPVFDPLNYDCRHLYSAPDTPNKILKRLEDPLLEKSGVKKDILSNVINNFEKNRVSENGCNKEIDDIHDFRRLLFKVILNVLITISSLQDNLNFKGDKSKPIEKILKSYLRSSANALNKLGSNITESDQSILEMNESGEKRKTKAESTTTREKAKNSSQNQVRSSVLRTTDKLSMRPIVRIKSLLETSNKPSEEQPQCSYILTTGAVDRVTSTPIDGNRYWKKRMLRQAVTADKLSDLCSNEKEKTKKVLKNNIAKIIPECKKSLLSTSSESESEDFDDKVSVSSSCKVPLIFKMGSERNQINQDMNSTTNGEKNLEKSAKRKRSQGSPKNLSPTNVQTPKKNKNQSPEDIVGNISSRTRRHFAYQEQCNKVIDAVYNLKESWPFREEYVNDAEPKNYYSIIKYAMFFETITSKLRKRLYYRVEDFVSDVRRVFWNTRYFFQKFPSSTSDSCVILNNCDIVEAFFENKLKSTFPFMDFSDITGSPQAGKTPVTEGQPEYDDLDVFDGNKIKGALRELLK